MVEIEIKGDSPLLTTLAVERTDTSDLPGRYCSQRDVWVIDSVAGPVPIVMAGSTTFDPVTKVRGERDNFVTPALLEISTKTRHELESEDVRPSDLQNLPELVTNADVIRERDDHRNPVITDLLELLTKTKAQSERDDR